MITQISRGSITVSLNGKIAIIGGEMFFPKNGKMGFVVYKNTIKKWSFPVEDNISDSEMNLLLEDIKADFFMGGNVLEIE